MNTPVGLATRSIDLARGALFILPIGLWIWLCHDWPARLGFHSDDWTILLHPFAGTSASFTDIFNFVIPRPVSAPYIWLAQVIVDWSPARSQVLSALMLLVTASSVGLLASALIRGSRLRNGAIAAACVAASLFIVFPSTVGTFAWGTGASAAVPALPLFCLGMILLLHSEGRRVGLGLLLVLLSHLSYEAFYFQEITLVLLATALSGKNIKDIPWRVLAAAAIVNIGCLAYNRLVVGGIHKPFNPNFIQILNWSYVRVGDIFRHATREHDILIGASALGTVLFGSICLARTVGFARMLIAALLVFFGIMAAVLLYAFAGYGLALEGPAARVSIVTATYFSLAAGVLASGSLVSIKEARIPAFLFLICAATGLLLLDLTDRHRVDEWAETWTYETERLARLPVEVFLGDRQRVYLAIEERPPSAVEPASEPWEIAGAVAWMAHNRTGDRLLGLNIWHNQPLRWFTSHTDWFNRWDGSRFEQGPCASMTTTYGVQGTELWAWKTSTTELYRIDAPWKGGC
jgi:hypothetical protein